MQGLLPQQIFGRASRCCAGFRECEMCYESPSAGYSDKVIRKGTGLDLPATLLGPWSEKEQTTVDKSPPGLTGTCEDAKQGPGLGLQDTGAQ
ncbi:hypothetical protein O3P69_014051 [Scylla paramamosain]|uniref:Uncharacterized protein n=1 Tax=Scylla paramamosain TaxID=85552 RepID=A0AAW0SS56_SCYPA